VVVARAYDATQKPKMPTDRAEPSVAIAATAAAEAATRSDAAAAATMELPVPQPQLNCAATTRAQEETPESIAKEVRLDQDGNEIEEDEDGKITDPGRELWKLEQYQQDIVRLQRERDQLLQQAATRNRADQTPKK
jgi:hypothetical protein